MPIRTVRHTFFYRRSAVAKVGVMAQRYEADVEWLDSEVEDSPCFSDEIGNMFSSSPNAKAGGKEHEQQMQRSVAGPSEHAEDFVDDTTSFDGQIAASRHYSAKISVPVKSVSQKRFQDVPIGLVADRGVAAKRALINRIRQESMTKLFMSCQAVLVRGASGNYYVYHLEISSDYYKQKWVVCKRYSEFYRLRKRLLAGLTIHKKQRDCSLCGVVRNQLKDVGFPRRIVMFQDPSLLVGARTAGLEEFIVALCEYLAAEQEVEVCSEIITTRYLVKQFLQFPLEHEEQHLRSIRELKYIDPRDVHVDSDSCPICLCEWTELDGNQLVLSPCGHFFHEHCINEWYRTRFDCPICRSISGIVKFSTRS